MSRITCAPTRWALSITARASWMKLLRKSTSDSGTSSVSLVDRVEQALEIGADAVCRLDQDDLRTVPAKAPEHVDVGRKLEG